MESNYEISRIRKCAFVLHCLIKIAFVLLFHVFWSNQTVFFYVHFNSLRHPVLGLLLLLLLLLLTLFILCGDVWSLSFEQIDASGFGVAAVVVVVVVVVNCIYPLRGRLVALTSES